MVDIQPQKWYYIISSREHTKKEVETMLEMISNENPVKFENKELAQVTTKIRNCGNNIRKNFYTMAQLLYEVHEKRLFVDDGFMSATEYAEKTFGFKKTLCYNLISIGEVYTDENGKESNLPHTGTKDYTSSQLKVLLPYDETDVRELADREEITPFMTVSALKKKLKAELQDEEEQAQDEEEQAQDEEEQAQDESPVEIVYDWSVRQYTDEDGNPVIISEGAVPEVIANAINEYLTNV